MQLVKWVLCAGMLSGMAVAPGLWTTTRPFPTMPAFPWVPDLPNPLALVLSITLVVSLVAIAVLRSPGRLVFAPPALGLVLALFDMSRLQPWFYEYGLMFAALSAMDWRDPDAPGSKAAWAGCAIVVAGFYFWSGLQKANPIFASQVFPWLLHPLGGQAATALSPFWPVAPIVETSIAALLLIPRSRIVGVGLAVAMNVLVLVALGPFGQNYDQIVWPWNLWLAVLAVVLFARTSGNVFGLVWSNAIGKVLVVLVGVMPALSFLGLWDGFLSASYYSGKLRDGWIYLTADGAKHLPKDYSQGNTGLVRESEDRYRLDILAWSMSKMNAPPYGEPRYYPGLVRRLEQAGVPAGEMVLVVQDPASLVHPERGVTVVPVKRG